MVTVHSAWLCKVKSDGSWTRLLQGTSLRYCTIDFERGAFSWSRSASQQLSRSEPIPFAQILGAELLPPCPRPPRSRRAAQERRFVLRTERRRIEFIAPTTEHAELWVRALTAAHSRRLRWDPCSAGASTPFVAPKEQEHQGEGRQGQGPLQALSRLERLKVLFSTNDSLQMLFRHHVDELLLRVVACMQTEEVRAGELLLTEGELGSRLYIVDSGGFEVFVAGSPLLTLGPGAVFGELALVSRRSTKSVRAERDSRVWVLERESFRRLLAAPEDTKTIGLLGGVMMLINNLAGPTIVSMPGLAQEAGWCSVVLVQVLVAFLACLCGHMVLQAMRRMPGNAGFDQCIEFNNLAKFYLPRWLYVFTMTCYHTNAVLSLMSLIIQSGQVLDYLTLSMHGCSPGLALSGGFGYTCGTRTDAVTPFGDHVVISSSMVLVGMICAPFASMNLDDNVILQYLAILGLTVMAAIWVQLLVSEDTFPTPIPTMTSSQSGLIGTVLFNFAFTSTLPSWANEKRKDVSVSATFAITMVYVVVLYSVVGIIGGMAYPPFYNSNENLFSKLNAGGSRLGRATVTGYPMLQNFTSIPVFSILIRNNLLQSGMSPKICTFIAVVLPWALSIPFYTGSGFDTISEVGGLLTSSIINFVIPVVLYVLARQRLSDLD